MMNKMKKKFYVYIKKYIYKHTHFDRILCEGCIPEVWFQSRERTDNL
jgi:hypothetical protein